MIAVIVVLSVMQWGSARRWAAMTFASVTVAHLMFMTQYTGLLYYGSAAFFDLAIMSILASLPRVTSLSLDLMKISMVSIFVNFIGYFMWLLYLPPHGYNAAFVAVYGFAIFAMLKKESDDVGHSAMDKRGAGVRCHRGPGDPYFH